MNSDGNRFFGGIITRLINKENLTREEAYEAFSQVLYNEVSEMQQGAFLAALTSKMETKEEIAGGWQAIYDIDTKKAKLPDTLEVMDNCGTGMDSFKTFNISTASSIIAASGGLSVARHGSRALTSKCGTVDIAEQLGVDVECTVEVVAESVSKTGVGLFNGMSSEVHPQALGRILSQITFGSSLNIAASLANPALPKMALRGVYSKEMLFPVIEVMREIGYTRALVVHGEINGSSKGIDEASVCGRTWGYHLVNGEICPFEINPEELGLGRHSPDGIAALQSSAESASHLVRLLSGNENGAAKDIVLLNTGLMFHVAEAVSSLADGVEYARELLDKGKALNKLEEWVLCQNRNPEKGRGKLNSLLSVV